MTPVHLWWYTLIALGLLNISLWFRQRSRHASRWPLMVTLSGLYVFGCATRGFLPKADVERFALFDTWFSSVFFGRSVATVAELAFVAQWSLVLGTLGFRRLGWMIFGFIAVAECFSWYAVISTHFLGNVVEESLWAVSFSVVSLVLYQRRYRLMALGCSAYVAFMVFVDVPMYLGRLRLQSAEGFQPRGFLEGILDLNTRRQVTWAFEAWRPEMPWMTLYFSFAVWMSLWLCGWRLGQISHDPRPLPAHDL